VAFIEDLLWGASHIASKGGDAPTVGRAGVGWAAVGSSGYRSGKSPRLARGRLEVDVLGEHADDQLGTICDAELLVETLEMGMDRMWRHPEMTPDIVLRLSEILDDARDDLKLASRQFQ
jgi:hypothetical protein